MGRPRASALARNPDSVLAPAGRAVNPELLDSPIEQSLDALSTSLVAWGRIQPLIDTWLDTLSTTLAADQESLSSNEMIFVTDAKGAERVMSKGAYTRAVMADLTTFLEKYSKIVGTITKALDQASRLRAFLTGGDVAPRLGEMSDAQLIDLLVHVAKARGLGPRIMEAA